MREMTERDSSRRHDRHAVTGLPMERFIKFVLVVSGLGFLACAVWLVAMPAHAASSEHIGPPKDDHQPADHPAAYCAARVQLAQLILEGMRDGTPIENINILFQQRAPTRELEQEREDWVAGLKAEILFERQGGAGADAEARIVRNIAARCGGTEI